MQNVVSQIDQFPCYNSFLRIEYSNYLLYSKIVVLKVLICYHAAHNQWFNHSTNIESSVCVFQGQKSVVLYEHTLYFRLLYPRMVDSSITFIKYVSEWATDLRARSSVVPVLTAVGTTFRSVILLFNRHYTLHHTPCY